MMKHAYLIICHQNLNQLMKLLRLIDDERNDVYLHVDKKAKDFFPETIINSINKANIYFVKRLSVNWGAYSQVECELLLLKEATKTEHSYYHFLSGLDLPLKTQDYIHDFFDNNYGKEYMKIAVVENPEQVYLWKISKYYFFQELILREKRNFFYYIQYFLLQLQYKLKIDRIKNCKDDIYQGSNWVSITHDLAVYILENHFKIKEILNHSFCGDEFFIQTVAMNSPFRDNIVNDNLRLIDWNRGKPYVFKVDDYSLLINSDCFYARKFDENIDSAIIEKISNHIIGIVEQ